MKNKIFICMIAFLIGGFFGCTKKVVKTETGAGEKETRQSSKPIETEVVEAREAKRALEDRAVESLAKKSAEVELIQREIRDVFFDYNRYNIRDDARSLLEDNASTLKANFHLKLVVEGHADERGTTEYNIALGERRAEAVRDYLVNLGVDNGRISTVSYGEERPFCQEQTEDCWQKNRRGHFVVNP